MNSDDPQLKLPISAWSSIGVCDFCLAEYLNVNQTCYFTGLDMLLDLSKSPSGQLSTPEPHNHNSYTDANIETLRASSSPWPDLAPWVLENGIKPKVAHGRNRFHL
jgi:hypothetical protein